MKLRVRAASSYSLHSCVADDLADRIAEIVDDEEEVTWAGQFKRQAHVAQ